MDKITHFFIKNPQFTLILSLFILLAGIIGFKNMNRETNPAVDFATAIITTSYPGASAKDIETRITKPIEDEIRQVNDVKDVRSVSQPGLSRIVIRIDMDKKGVDIPKTMADLQRAVDRTSNLPADLEDLPKFLEIKSEEYPIVNLAITGTNENRLRDVVADLLKDEIQDNKSVKSVSLDGYSDRRFNIDLDLQKMSQNHIGINEVTGKIRSRNVDFPSGDIKNDSTQALTRIEAKVKNIDDLSNIIIRSNFSGQVIRLKDIAKISDNEEDPRFLARYNGLPAVILNVNKKSQTDALELVADINSKIAEFSKRYEGQLQFHFVYDEAKEVKSRLSVLTGNAFSGLVIVMVLLSIFFPWRIGIATAISVPFAIISTLAVMFFMGINLNTVTILALVIVLGMLDDQSVVISENFVKSRHEGLSPLDSVLRTVKVLWLPITITSLTTIAAFLPMLITRGIMGEFIKWIPIVVTITLLLSLLECFCFLPTRLYYLGKNIKEFKDEDEVTDWFHRVELKFEKLVALLIRFRYSAILGFFGVIFFSLFMVFGANKFILFPSEQTLIYTVKFEAKDGSRVENTSAVIQELSQKIKEKMGDGAKHIVGRAGLNDPDASQPSYLEGSDVGYLWIYVDDYTRNNVPYNDVLKKLRTIKSNNTKELVFDVVINGPPVGKAIEATFRSNSFDDIDQIIALIKNDLAKVPGISDLAVDDNATGKEIFVNIDYEKADRLGLNVEAIGGAIRSAVAGSIISQITLDNKEVDLFVRFEEKYRTSIADLKKITIMDNFGNLVPLNNFVSFEEAKASPFIKRYDYKRSKTLMGNVDDKVISAGEANKHVRELFAKYKDKFPSVSVDFGGVEESTSESLDSLKRAFIFALMAIFVLQVFLFRSYVTPFIILTTIPLGLFGFGVAFFLHQKPVSFLAVIGLIGLSGVIVNSGIVLISYILRLEKEDKKRNFHEILAYASSMRLRSVVVTALTTIAGFAPTAYGIGGKDEVLSPMTLAMMWGLTSATIFTIMWVPCAYAILDDVKTFFRNRFKLTFLTQYLNKL